MAKPRTRKPETPAPDSLQPLELPQDAALTAEEPPAPELLDEVQEVQSPEPAAVDLPAEAESQPAPEPETREAPKAAAVTPKPRNGFFPLIAGGAAAAALGAVATLAVLPRLPEALRSQLMPPSGLSALRDDLTAQAEQIESLKRDLALAREAQPGADQAGLATALEEAKSAADAAQKAASTLEARVAALENAPPAAASEGTDWQPQIDALKAQLAAMDTAQSATEEQLAAAAAEAQARIAAAEEAAAQLRASSEAAARQALAQAALARLHAAFEAGTALAPALADAEAAGLSVPDTLKAPVPTLAQLQASFPEAARKALALARKHDAGESLGDRLGSFLLAQTGARPLTPQEGTAPDAVLSRVQVAVDEGRLADALTEIAALPEPARAELQAWQAQAGLRLAAAQALQKLSQ